MKYFSYHTCIYSDNKKNSIRQKDCMFSAEFLTTSLYYYTISVVCEVSENASSLNTSQTSPLYNEVWNQGKTVPFFLLIILVPLLNFKSPTFFTKFNSLGELSPTPIFVKKTCTLCWNREAKFMTMEYE